MKIRTLRIDVPRGAESATVDITRQVEGAIEGARVDVGMCVVSVNLPGCWLALAPDHAPQAPPPPGDSRTESGQEDARPPAPSTTDLGPAPVAESLTLPIVDGEIRMGSWCRLILCDPARHFPEFVDATIVGI